MATVNPYLTFKGNCEEAFKFYQSVFGGEFPYVGRYKDMPEGSPIPESELEKIMHISLPIGGGTTLMGADSSEAFGHTTIIGDNISIYVAVDSEAEADRVFNALSVGGAVQMPLGKTFWGAYFGMFTDKFGINWMLSYDMSEGA
jgi:PhnB protein